MDGGVAGGAAPDDPGEPGGRRDGVPVDAGGGGGIDRGEDGAGGIDRGETGGGGIALADAAARGEEGGLSASSGGGIWCGVTGATAGEAGAPMDFVDATGTLVVGGNSTIVIVPAVGPAAVVEPSTATVIGLSGSSENEFRRELSRLLVPI